MTLPGLPPPRRVVLPAPPGGAAAARRAGGRRRASAAGAALGVVGIAAGAVAVSLGTGPPERLQVAVNPPAMSSDSGTPERLSGRAVDEAGRPVARVAVLRDDLTAVLTRTGPDGGWSVPCGSNLILAAYAPSARGGAARERSPGAGNHAWRRVVVACGGYVRVVLPDGGAVEGRGRPGSDVRLERTRGRSTEVLPAGPVFVTRVRADGTWRIEGLDTGRYRFGDGRVVDVREGQTVRAG